MLMVMYSFFNESQNIEFLVWAVALVLVIVRKYVLICLLVFKGSLKFLIRPCTADIAKRLPRALNLL